MNRKLLQQVFFFILLSALLWIAYSFCIYYVKVLTLEVLHANPSSKGWTSWMYELYPRLQTEKWRFNETFFISKTKQVLIRSTMSIQLIVGVYLFRSYLIEPLRATYDRRIQVNIQRKFIPIITLLLYTCLALVVYNAILEFKALMFFAPFYKPAGIGKLLLPVFPPISILWFIYFALIGSIASVILLPKKWIAASLAAVAFIYYQLILFGFGKYDHGFSTLTYALLIYPFFLWESEKSNDDVVPAWSIVLIQWMICLAYFYCGLEKIFTSGIYWFASDNLQQHLLIHETSLGLKLASHAMLCKILSFGVILLQLSFILLPFQKRLAYILLPAGFIFHSASWLLLDAGGLFNPWWGVYLFFLFPLQSQETK
ncbi:MAG: hypothetical protein JWM14_3084 [Chitinophagaceae bacterium]|nr:hypothetical protein [Chitinophagaceae bacterium]